MKKTIVSVICSYNGAKYIDQQIKSILNQKGIDKYDHKVILYDNGSTDDTVKVAEANNIEVVHSSEYRGVFLNFLFAIRENIKDSDWIFLADQDDFFEEDKYLIHIKKHDESKKGLVISRSIRKDSEFKGDVEGTRTVPLEGHNMSIMAKYVNKNIVNNIDTFTEWAKDNTDELTFKYISADNHDLFLIHLFGAEDDIAFIDKFLTWKRMHPVSFTQVNKNKYIKRSYGKYYKGYRVVFKKFFGIKYTVNKYNEREWKNYKFTPNILDKISLHLNNFAMYVRMPFLRNFIDYI